MKTIEELLIEVGEDKHQNLSTTSFKFKTDLWNFFKGFEDKVCVEFGTHKGQTTRILSFLFDRVHTINNNENELAKELNRERNIIVHQGKTETPANELLEKWQTLIKLADVLGLTAQPEPETPKQDSISDTEIEELIQERQEARKNKNFAESDRIRDQLLTKGITLIDSKEGTRWHR